MPQSERDAMGEMVQSLATLPMPEHVARYAREIDYDPVLGTMQLVDEAARRRGLAAVRDATVISLGRPLRDAATFRRDGGRTFEIEHTLDNGDGPGMGVYSDYIRIFQHGLTNTHLEGINHMLWDGTVYGGHRVGTPEAAHTDVMAWAERGWVTRGVLADIPALRGVDFVDWDTPVTGAEIEASLDAAGVSVEPGDALLLHMGYDAAARHAAARGIDIDGLSPEFRRPGLGGSGAEWIVEHRVALLVYDFEDAEHPDEPHAGGQLL
ncbi:MAG TPA: cyclase family protein, partial [Pseudonocardia sp.]|nr:cyclase family protein [Pseudonocardia sp.]